MAGRTIVKLISHTDGETYAVALISGTIYRLIRGVQAKLPNVEFVAEKRFIQLCSMCHGINGRGVEAFSTQIGKPMPDFSAPDWHAQKTDVQIREIISKGGAATGLSPIMPAWKWTLSIEEIDSLTKYIRSL